MELIDSISRKKMVTWCRAVLDTGKLSREIMEITVSFMNRYLATPEGTPARYSRKAYKLAYVTALYTAIKIHETKCISAESLAAISRGLLTARDIEVMESHMLDALKWRVNPPTAWDFVRKLMNLVFEEIPDEDMHWTVMRVALLQTELAVVDDLLLTAKASTLAYAATMNSLSLLGLDDWTLLQFSSIFTQALNINGNDMNVLGIQNYLYQFVAPDGVPNIKKRSLYYYQQCDSMRSTPIPVVEKSVDISPRGVSQAGMI